MAALSFCARSSRVGCALVLGALLGGCQQPPTPAPPPGLPSDSTHALLLADAFARADHLADSLDDRLRPVSILRLREIHALQQASNDDQLVVARRLGIVPPGDSSGIEALRAEGRLVPIPPATEHWEVRPLEHSRALLTPRTLAFLTDLCTRFQARLAALGLPPLRLEVTSALRTADSQADLRRTNRNATEGRSTHEYGTTFDVAYSAFRAPLAPLDSLPPGLPAPLVPLVRRYEAARVEAVAARRSRELEAELGRLLRALQDDGRVYVTLEQEQPVFHLTVRR